MFSVRGRRSYSETGIPERAARLCEKTMSFLEGAFFCVIVHASFRKLLHNGEREKESSARNSGNGKAADFTDLLYFQIME